MIHKDIFYFAVFDARDIFINRKSVMGDFCSNIQCGYPFMTEEMRKRYQSDSREIEGINEITDFMRGDDILKEHFLFNSLTCDATSWWQQYSASNGTMECITSLNGCEPADEWCHVAFAMQSIVPGPVVSHQHIGLLTGATEEIKHLLIHRHHKSTFSRWNKHATDRRVMLGHHIFDIGVHIRNEFDGFEFENNVNQSMYDVEVTNWLASNNCQKIFYAVKEKIGLIASEIFVSRSSTQNLSPVTVYIAADNSRVKLAIESLIMTISNSSFPIQIIKLADREVIRHAVHVQSFNDISNHSSLFEFSFDWYALAMSNCILSYRKNNQDSTFAVSARRYADRVGFWLGLHEHELDVTAFSWRGLP